MKNTAEVKIHPTAIVHPTAELDTGVEVGPYSIIGENVRIGKNTRVGPHVVVHDNTTIGSQCRLFQFSSVGMEPQDISYRGEPTETIIGDRNVIREFVTIHKGTPKDKGKTICGNDNYFMNYVHIAHDCVIGNHVIMANAATLGGHVIIDDYAIVGGLVAIHQYVRIGAYSFIGGASAVSKDIPPYVMAVGNRAHLHGLNSVGLRRQGFGLQDLKEIRRAYAILFKSSMPLKEAAERLKEELPDSAHAKRFLQFIEGSKRGVAKERPIAKETDPIED